MTNKYYSIWSDNLHKFGEPSPLPSRGVLIDFPDIIIYADNLERARERINLINIEAQGKNREDLIILAESSFDELNRLVEIGKKGGAITGARMIGIKGVALIKDEKGIYMIMPNSWVRNIQISGRKIEVIETAINVKGLTKVYLLEK